MKNQKCKGMQDLLPEEMLRFRRIEDVFRSCCRNSGYQEVRTPTLEYLHLFTAAGTLTPSMLSGVLASMADIEYLRSNVARIVTERDRLFGKLKELAWLRPHPSSGNFILCSLPRGKAKEIWQQLRRKGIFVRYFDTSGLKDCLRITVGKPEDTNALIKALEEVNYG